MIEEKEYFEDFISEKLRLFEEQSCFKIKNIAIIQEENLDGEMKFNSIKIEVE